MRVDITQEEKQQLLKFAKRAFKVIVFILIVRLVRMYIRANANEYEFIRELYTNGNEGEFVQFVLIPMILIACLIIMASMFLIKGRPALVHPFFAGVAIFGLVDIITMFMFPEIFVAVLDSTLFHKH